MILDLDRNIKVTWSLTDLFVAFFGERILVSSYYARLYCDLDDLLFFYMSRTPADSANILWISTFSLSIALGALHRLRHAERSHSRLSCDRTLSITSVAGYAARSTKTEACVAYTCTIDCHFANFPGEYFFETNL